MYLYLIISYIDVFSFFIFKGLGIYFRKQCFIGFFPYVHTCISSLFILCTAYSSTNILNSMMSRVSVTSIKSVTVSLGLKINRCICTLPNVSTWNKYSFSAFNYLK